MDIVGYIGDLGVEFAVGGDRRGSTFEGRHGGERRGGEGAGSEGR